MCSDEENRVTSVLLYIIMSNNFQESNGDDHLKTSLKLKLQLNENSGKLHYHKHLITLLSNQINSK